MRKNSKIKCTTPRFCDTIGALIPPGRPPKMTERRVLSVIRGPSPVLGKELIFLGDEVRMKLNLFDSHVHTAHSFDARDGIGEICAHALDHGVMGVAITDH